MTEMKTELTAVDNFRLNFHAALYCDGRSLSRFARDISTSTPYLSRIRSATKNTDSGQPIVPGLDTCERIAHGLGYNLIDMLRPADDFRKILRQKFQDFRARDIPKLRTVRYAAKKRKAKATRKKTPAA